MEKSTRWLTCVVKGAPRAAIASFCLAAVLVAVACAGEPFSAGGADAGPDVTTSSDASIESGMPADSGGLDVEASAPFCASAGQHSFCEDFDTTGVPGKFVPLTQSPITIGTAGSKITADTMAYMSAPNSALAQTPPLLTKSGDQAAALLTASVSASSTQASRLKLSFEVQVGQGCVGNADGATIALLETGQQYAVGIAVLPTEARLLELELGSDGGIQNATIHPFSTVPTEPTWFALALQLDLRAKTATVSIDGANALDSLPLTLSPPSSASSAVLFLGAEVKDAQGISGGCKVHVDNVLFDIL